MFFENNNTPGFEQFAESQCINQVVFISKPCDFLNLGRIGDQSCNGTEKTTGLNACTRGLPGLLYFFFTGQMGEVNS